MGLMIQQDDIEYLPDTVSNAYHGTGATEAKGILKEGFQLPTISDDYLGDGTYFYIGSIEDAKFFARRRKNEKKYAVLRATVLLGYCLDLDVPRYKHLLARIYLHILERPDVKRKMDERNTEIIPLGLAINTLGRFTTIHTVKGIQINRESVEEQPGPYLGSKMWYYTKMMLCVREQENIEHPPDVVLTNEPSLHEQP